ncbi:MAG: beta-galactosidase [Kiritimatiellae bacterium]|nr:beta-galactosidase [Kiritimatiellia bacterium]
MKKALFCKLSALFCAAAAVPAPGAMQCRFLHEMTGEVVTPHHDFRGSAAERPLKTLFLLDRGGGRDAVEAVQRFNVAPTYFLMVSGNRIAVEDMYESAWKGTTLHEKTRELDVKLGEKYDLYVFGRKWLTSVNEEHRYRILKAVHDEGAGLLLVSDTGTPRIPYRRVYAEKLPVPEFAAKFPREYEKTSLQGWRFGRGRVVELAWRCASGTPHFSLAPSFPVNDEWLAKYENAMALVGAAMRYAAGRDDTPSEPAVTRLRDRFNRKVADATCGGRYFRDVIGANGAVAVEEVVTASPVGGMYVEADEAVKPGTPFTVKAVWTNASPLVAAARFETVESPFGRVMTRRECPVAAGATEVSAEIADARISTKAGYARVTLLDRSGRALDIAEKTVFFPERRVGDYVQMGWDTVLAMHPFAGASILVDRLGFDLGLTHPSSGGGNIRAMAVLNQSSVPYMVRIGLGAAENGSSRQTMWFFLDREAAKRMKELEGDLCFYRPEVKRLWADGIRNRMRNLPKYAPAFYSLGDENWFSETAGFGEWDDRFFREFLKLRYGTIEALNRDWRTNCADFASVPHLRPETAKKIGNLAAWGDHRAYMEKMYADVHAFCRAEIRKLDPGAPVGAEGSVPGDLELTFERLEFWGPYSNLIEDEALRSLGGDRIRMLWWGGYPSSHGGRAYTPFPLPLMSDLAKGTVMGNAWFTVNVGSNHSMFYSDLKLADDVEGYLVWHDRFKNGLAQLLIRNPMKDDGVLLYWSHPSRSASFADGRYLSPYDGLARIIRHCYRTGRSFEFVSARTLGRLKNARTVFLCGATALSDAEVAVLRDFAADGGRLVADVEPAVLNDRLAPRGKGALTDLFGKNGSVMFGGRITLSEAKGGRAGEFESAIAGCMPAQRTYAPGARMHEDAVLRTRRGPGFDIVTAMWPVSAPGGKVDVTLTGGRFIYEPMVGFVGEAGKVVLDFSAAPFVCRTVFEVKQEAPDFEISGAAPGGEAVFRPPPLVPGRFLHLEITDAAGAVRRSVVFDRKENLPRRLFVGVDEPRGEWRAVLTDCATGLKTTKTMKVGK